MSENFVSLKSAAEAKIAGISKATYFNVDPDKIEIEPGFNRPIDRENVEQFKTAIENGATIPPIFVKVEAGRIIMRDGEHRLIAVKELRANGMEIPTMSAIQFRGNDADGIAHLITSAQGKGLSPLDAGLQYMKLTRLQWTVKMIADRIGRSTTHVEQCLALAESGSDVQAHIRAGDVSSTTAGKIVKEHGSNAGTVIKDALAAGAAKDKTKVTPKMAAPKEKQKPKEVQKLLALLDRCRPYVLKVMDDPEARTVAISTASQLKDDIDAASVEGGAK